MIEGVRAMLSVCISEVFCVTFQCQRDNRELIEL